MKHKLTLIQTLLAAFALTGCNGNSDNNTQTINVADPDTITQTSFLQDNTEAETQEPVQAETPQPAQEENDNARDMLNDVMRLKLSDFLSPIQEFDQYEISENIPATLQRIKFNKGKKSSGQKIHIMGGPGKSYKTTYTRNYNGSDITVVLNEKEYNFEGEDIKLTEAEVTFGNSKDMELFLSDLPKFKHLKKTGTSNGRTTYQDIGDLRVYVRDNTVSFEYQDYPF